MKAGWRVWHAVFARVLEVRGCGFWSCRRVAEVCCGGVLRRCAVVVCCSGVLWYGLVCCALLLWTVVCWCGVLVSCGLL